MALTITQYAIQSFSQKDQTLVATYGPFESLEKAQNLCNRLNQQVQEEKQKSNFGIRYYYVLVERIVTPWEAIPSESPPILEEN